MVLHEGFQAGFKDKSPALRKANLWLTRRLPPLPRLPGARPGQVPGRGSRGDPPGGGEGIGWSNEAWGGVNHIQRLVGPEVGQHWVQPRSLLRYLFTFSASFQQVFTALLASCSLPCLLAAGLRKLKERSVTYFQRCNRT
jgi:hypothetical protein